MDSHTHKVSSWIILLLAISCGIIAANIYYAQPLVGLISTEIGLPPEAAGLIVTLTQIGYGLGLLFIVPLGDLVENRRLVVSIMMVGILALASAGIAQSALFFLTASIFIGLGSVAVQVLVPYAAHLSPEANRGHAVGRVMSGLLLGIMLARPISSFVTSLWGWRTVFYLSALLVAALALILQFALPKRQPVSVKNYGNLLMSLWSLMINTPILRRRAAYHAGLFGAFSLFWTAVPLLLASPVFHLSQREIALFTLAGVSGAIAAPIAGRLADRGFVKIATLCAILAVAAAFLMTFIGQSGSSLSLTMLVLAAVLLDLGVSANLVLGQREIFSLGAEIRGRLNGLYLALFFAGGAIGSALGGWAYAKDGWLLCAWIGFALAVPVLLYFASEWQKSKRVNRLAISRPIG